MIKIYTSYFYLLLAIIGGSITFSYVMLGTMAQHGNFNLLSFIQSTWIDSYYAKSLTIDFWTGAIAGTFFVIVEGNRLKMKLFWLYPLLIVFIGFAFGFPLFLYFRHKKIIAESNL